MHPVHRLFAHGGGAGEPWRPPYLPADEQPGCHHDLPSMIGCNQGFEIHLRKNSDMAEISEFREISRNFGQNLFLDYFKNTFKYI